MLKYGVPQYPILNPQPQHAPMNAQAITLFNAARLGDADTLRQLVAGQW
jgi:hypothetical protein